MSWKSRGLRGSFFEELVNRTNEHYRERGIKKKKKIPTPITPIEIDKSSRHITLAYFDQKSTVDYIGLAQGVAICFDCKECASDTFALQNVHEHQIAYMKDFEAQGGIAFLLIYYGKREQIYYMRYRELARFYERAVQGGRKSVRLEELDPKYLHPVHQSLFVNYLAFVNQDLAQRDA